MTRRCLIVDDEQAYGRQLRLLLEPEGYEVQVAAGVDEAIECGRSSRPELLIADWQLGHDKTGVDLARELQAENPDLRVLIITGFPREQLSIGDSPIHSILEKPFGIDEFLQAVRDVEGDRHDAS